MQNNEKDRAHQNKILEELTMSIKARTEYTEKVLLKHARFNAVKNPSQIVVYIFSEIIMLGMIWFSFYSAITENEAIGLAYVFAVVFPFFVPFLIFIIPIIAAKGRKNLIGGVNTYEFSDNEIIIDTNINEAMSQSKMNYNSLLWVYETKEYFYLYISQNAALILGKSDISVGRVEDLRNLFIKHISVKKYFVRGMKKG